MKLHSRVCEILQIEQPIVLAGMGGAVALHWRRQCLMPVVSAYWERQPAARASYGNGFVKPAK